MVWWKNRYGSWNKYCGDFTETLGNNDTDPRRGYVEELITGKLF